MLTAETFHVSVPDAPLLDRLVEAFRHFYSYYVRNRQVSLDLLRELTFYSEGLHRARYLKTRDSNLCNALLYYMKCSSVMLVSCTKLLRH